MVSAVSTGGGLPVTTISGLAEELDEGVLTGRMGGSGLVLTGRAGASTGRTCWNAERTPGLLDWGLSSASLAGGEDRGFLRGDPGFSRWSMPG